MTELAEAAKAYKETKEAHKHAANVAREAVLAALKAGNSVPEVTKAGPFTYAYVRGIAEDNGIPRDERKARYQKSPEQVPAQSPSSTPPAVSFMSAADRANEIINMARGLRPGRLVEIVSGLEQQHWKWLKSKRRREHTDLDIVEMAIRDGLLSTSDLR